MIVVFGSINVDIGLVVPALPRPGETVLSAGYACSPGGKGANQALAAARCGADVAMFGCVGRDGFADLALSGLLDSGVRLDGVRRVADPTGLAAVCVDPAGENQIVVAGGANLAVRAGDVPDDALDPETVVVMQLEVPIAEIAVLAERARSRGARVVLNAAPARPLPPALLDALDVLIVNEPEAAALARATGLPVGTPDRTALALADGIGASVAVTLGARGAVLADAGNAFGVDALPITPRDTTGAGDAFAGAFAAALDRSLGPREALIDGTIAGGLACLASGAQASLPTRAALEGRRAALSVYPISSR